MKLVVIGDSITKGTFTAPGQDAPNSVAKPYGPVISEYLNYEFINYGINGISYSKTSSINSDCSLENRINEYELGDITIIAAGVNDFITNVQMDDFSIALDYVYSSIKKRQQNKKIYVLSPLPIADTKRNDVGHSLDEYRKVVKEKAKEYGFAYIDGGKFPLNPNEEEIRQKYIFDGVHLNDDAHKLLAKYIMEYLK